MSSQFTFFKHYHDFHEQPADLHRLTAHQITQLFKKYQNDLAPPILFPAPYFVHDFTKPQESLFPYSIGKYDEDRSGLYTQALFQSQTSARTIHVGIDFGMPPNSPVYAMMDGQIIAQGALPSDGPNYQTDR